MSSEKILQEFERVASVLSIRVRYEKGDFRGGICKVGNEQVIIINKKSSTSQKIDLFASEFSKLKTDEMYMIPAAREMIENKTIQSVEPA